MMTILLATGGAFWLGVLTSISPCPMATNLAAISYVGRQVGKPSRVMLSGLLYTLGRVLVYVVLAAILVASLLSSPTVSMWLQQNLNKFLGPMLILVGMVLLGLLNFGIHSAGAGERLRAVVDRLGLAGAGVMGLVFGLSFCPVSAALYFGSLLPLAVEHQSGILLPMVYGIGTGIPVIIFAGLFAVSANRIGAAFQRLTQVEGYVRIVTGVAILVIGVYLTLHHVYHVV
jgi:cytochrome c-type biogenesis protein